MFGVIQGTEVVPGSMVLFVLVFNYVASWLYCQGYDRTQYVCMYLASQRIAIGLLFLGGALGVIKLYAFCHGSPFVFPFSLLSNLILLLRSAGLAGFHGCSSVLLCRISHGEGMWGPMGLEKMFLMRSSTIVFDVLAVVNVAFIVLICYLMNPFDWRYKGDDLMCVMCCAAIDCAKASDANRGLLLVCNHLGCPYHDNICWNLICAAFVILYIILNMKGYLLNVSQMKSIFDVK